MNYYLYQNNQFVKSFPTQEAGVAGIDKLLSDWQMNAPRHPALKLCYNGFESVTIKEYSAS